MYREQHGDVMLGCKGKKEVYSGKCSLRKLHLLRNFFFFNARALAKENLSVNLP